ncbi:NACHT domain-containing protein [Sphaerothrix gracilis]|uniref:NACHT domain-containing protein n=1 Tax=Sphaerothrix gracilis TaxID=3151835 RepID=UPI0031FBAF00
MQWQRWQKRYLSSLFALSLVITIAFSSIIPIWSQTSPPTQDSLIAEIEATAERHAKTNSPMQTRHVVELYAEDASQVGLSNRKIAAFYETAYIKFQSSQRPDPWKTFRPQAGWTVATILFVLLAFRDALKDWIKTNSKRLEDWIYNQFAGSKLFQAQALERYRQALVEKHQRLKIPFRPNRPLEVQEVFVPLKVADSANSTDQIDAYCALAENRRLMIKGQPGSGKTMFIKHIVFTYGREQFNVASECPTPILLELHRLSNPELTQEGLINEIIAAFGRYDFPKAERFVQQSLKQGKLMLLLDGLDEVNSSVRQQVVKQIQNLLDIYGQCRAVITCRTAVYNGEFDQLANQTLEVVEFSDQQIRRFLEAWKEQMPANKSVDHLMQTLRDRPRIMALTRNPLVLTIVAYLHTDTAFILPHSRAEFYQQSTQILLDQWRGEFNRYKATSKRRVLQHLALYAQDNADRQQKDRRSLGHFDVIAQIKQLLPNINLDAEEDTEPILTEIIERSGLLLKIDGGERYQFAHLTIQEYFSATALVEDSMGLVQRWEDDPNMWRETAKLWCGLSNDSTNLIQTIAKKDKLTAFECLADTQQIDLAVATDLINRFQNNFKSKLSQDTLKAFGTVAADTRPRGQDVFDFLKNVLETNQDIEHRLAAAKALSFTNLPNAAEVLATYLTPEVIGKQIIRMGDVAVPVLGKTIEKPNANRHLAVDYLIKIATPEAACKLVPLMWDENNDVVVQAAWGLASLIPLPGVEDALKQINIEPKYSKENILGWLLDPFDETTNSLVIIYGRIGYIITYLIELPRLQSQRPILLDPRIVISCCGVELAEQITISEDWDPGYIDALLAITDETSEWQDKAQNLVENISTSNNFSSRWLFLLKGLPLKLQLGLLKCFMEATHKPTVFNWQNLFNVVNYNFQSGKSYFNVLLISGSLSAIAIGQMFFLINQNIKEWWNGAIFLGIYILLIFWLSLYQNEEQRFDASLFEKFGLWGATTFWIQIRQLLFNRVAWPEIFYVFQAVTIAGTTAGIAAIAMAVAGAKGWTIAVTGTFAMAGAGAWAGAWAGFRAVLLSGVVALAGAWAWTGAWAIAWVWTVVVAWAGAWAWSGAWTVAMAVAGGVAVAVAVAMVVTITWVWTAGIFGALAGAAAGCFSIASVLSGVALGAWYRTNKTIDKRHFLAVFAFPWFCAAPIVLVFSTLGLHNLFTWPQTLAIQAVLLGTCCLLWWNGQRRHRQAQNPLQGGIIEETLRQYKRT